MINIKKSVSILILILQSCMEPNTEDLWSVSIDTIMQTEGFARSITIEGSSAFVAAGQSGVQVWNLQDHSLLYDYKGYEELGTFSEFEDLALVGRDAINNLLFVSESNKDVKIFHFDGGDSLIYRNTIMSARTKDFISFPSDLGQFVMYSADNDDGLKWSIYEPVPVFDQIYWNPVYPPIEDAELYTPGKPLGIDSDGQSKIAMAVDQLGVELYTIDSLGANPEFVGRVDTEGNAEKVTFSTSGVFVACDNAGAYYIPFENFSTSKTSFSFAQDFTVDHIAINSNIAVLSLGSKGIALYDISNPESPIERGVFPIGYSYMSVFWEDKLLVCSREGLQLITITQ